MRGALLFAAGLLAGMVIHQGMAQNSNTVATVMMNHVGISVPNIDEAVAYYTQKLGYREAFRLNDKNGRPRIVYLHISKNTFLELNPVAPGGRVGFSHYGLVVGNAAQAVARFRRSGLTVTDPVTSDTRAVIANITDPYMGRIELVEITPDSLHAKAIQAWK